MKINQKSKLRLSNQTGEPQLIVECSKCEELEEAFVRVRSESLRLRLSTTSCHPEKLHLLDNEEIVRLFALIDHKATEH